MEATVGNKFVKAPRTMPALGEWLIRELLQYLFHPATFAAFILV
jgi:hypothetical protein